MKKTLSFFLCSCLMSIIGSALFVNGIVAAGYFFLGISAILILLTIAQVVKFVVSKN